METQANLSWQLERYIFDAEHSAHPAAAPQAIGVGIKKDYRLSQAFRFCTDVWDTLEPIISFVCAEPGDSVTLVLPFGVTPKLTPHLMTDTPAARQIRPLIGALTPETLRCSWIQEAEQIDLRKWEGA